MPRQPRPKRFDSQHHAIPDKANRILNVILIAFILVIIRIWHLAVVQYESRLEESRKPQRKTIVEPATRATIRDRFNIPLAVNKIHYQAAVLYSHLREIPSIAWEKDADGKRVRKWRRKEYIKQLSQLLAEELGLDAERIEDLIHAKASYYAQVPFVIKEDITEKEYYRLKMLEREWPGIYVRRLPQRCYPKERTAADVIGYMGAINRQEYEAILQEMRQLENGIVQFESGEEPEWPKGVANYAEARRRVKDLEEKAYSVHDYVGKAGIEAVFEQQLRGFYGKRSFYSDSRGNFLRELPGSRPPLSGYRILLTISAELQEYAEKLLAQNESIRLVRKCSLGTAKQTLVTLKHPWIKGGAIVVMDPQTGEVLTLASYPRFDPNDFIASGRPDLNREKKHHINRWFENEAHLAAIWDRQQPLERERYDDRQQAFYDEQRWLTWDHYLDFILPSDGALRKLFYQVTQLGQVYEVQQLADRALTLCAPANLYAVFNALYNGDIHIPYPVKMTGEEKQWLEKTLNSHGDELRLIRDRLSLYFDNLPQNYDKVLFVDICRLILDTGRISEDLIEEMQGQSINTYQEACGALVSVMSVVKEMSKGLYHDLDFKEWRASSEKEFLKQKRQQEKISKTYPKPYLDYLDQQENQMFQAFWEESKWKLLTAFLTGYLAEKNHPYLDYFQHWHKELKQGAHQAIEWKKTYRQLQEAVSFVPSSLAISYLQSLRSYQDLNRPLLGKYRGLRHPQHLIEKSLAAAFYPVYGFGYGRSHAYRQATIQGSIFKLITAYEALVQRFRALNKDNPTLEELNPLIIVDRVFQEGKTNYVGYTQEGKPIPQLYKGGRIPRSLAHRNNGEVDLIRALAVSSNPYFSLLAGEHLQDPEDLARAAELFSYGKKTGIDLPAEIAGKIPDDLSRNRTGLYAMAIGQHSLVVTPLQTAVMLSAIANGGKVLKPKIVSLMAGRQPNREEGEIVCPPSFDYQESLGAVGIDFPLFISTSRTHQKNLVDKIANEVKREIFMPQAVRSFLLKGLRAVSVRTYAESIASLTRLYQQQPEVVRGFIEMKDQMLGKSSTSESVEHIDLDLNEGTNIYTHVWFGSIAFQNHVQDKNRSAFIIKDEFGKPEVVVVVYLRYGGYGKEAAPLAAQMVKKWRELKQKYNVAN